MSFRRREAERRSFGFIYETCPRVDEALETWRERHCDLIPPGLVSALDELLERFKEAGTYRLREALNCACAELLDAEDRADELQRTVETLLKELAESREVTA